MQSSGTSRVIAINLALIPPPEIIKLAEEVNRDVMKHNSNSYRIDATRPPHLTLVQQFIDESTVHAAVTALTGVVKNWSAVPQTILRVEIPERPMYIAAEIKLADEPKVVAYRQAAINALKNFKVTGNFPDAFELDPGETLFPLCIEWTNTNTDDPSLMRPHFSLGLGKSSVQIPPTDFTVDRLALCQMGNYNTCRTILHEWKLSEI